jgi:hypothetical protein
MPFEPVIKLNNNNLVISSLLFFYKDAHVLIFVDSQSTETFSLDLLFLLLIVMVIPASALASVPCWDSLP